LTLESGPGFTVALVSTRTISMAAADAGVSPDTLRYYERVGLLAPPERSANGYRVYDGLTTERVRLIKGAQGLGLRLDSIRELLAMLDRGRVHAATPDNSPCNASPRSMRRSCDSPRYGLTSSPWPLASSSARPHPPASAGAEPS